MVPNSKHYARERTADGMVDGIERLAQLDNVANGQHHSARCPPKPQTQ